MNLTMLKGKIHRAVVKQAELHYVGSITVDPKLLEAAGILEYEMVQIVDVENGSRFRHDLLERSGSQTGCGRRSYYSDELCADDTKGSRGTSSESSFCR